MAQLKLAPDLAASSRKRMCEGGLEEERRAIFEALGLMEKAGGWNIKLAHILKSTSVVTLYRALTFENIWWSRHFCASGRGSGTERSSYTA